MHVTNLQAEAILDAVLLALSKSATESQHVARSLESDAKWLLLDTSKLKEPQPGLTNPERAATVIEGTRSALSRARQISYAFNAYSRLLDALRAPLSRAVFSAAYSYPVWLAPEEAATALCALSSSASQDTDLGTSLATIAPCSVVTQVASAEVRSISVWLAPANPDLASSLMFQSPHMTVLQAVLAANSLS